MNQIGTGNLIVREVSGTNNVPTGKKLVVVAGVFVVDDITNNETVYRAVLVEGVNGDVLVHTDQMRPLHPSVKSWCIEDILTQGDISEDMPRPESTRSAEFTRLMDKALKTIAHGGCSLKQAKNLIEQIEPYQKQSNAHDVIGSVVGSVLSVLRSKAT